MIQNKKDLPPTGFIRSDTQNFGDDETTSTISNKSPLLFISKISHELRSILHVIINLSTALNLYAKTNEEQEQYINVIAKYSEDLNNLISILLISNSNDNSDINIHRKFTNISTLVKDAINQYKFSLPKENAQKIEYHSNIEEVVAFIDPFWIKQVILNLLDNAMKYGNNSNITVTLESILSNNKESISISVIDEGLGIPEKDIKSIFNLYKRINHDNNISKSGDGIGLHICQEIVKGHLGFIEAHNNAQKGFTVRIVLPKNN